MSRTIGAADLPTAAPISRLAGVALPAIPSARGQTMLALQAQLDRSQWLPAPHIAAHQFEQLRVLIEHARTQVAHYRDHLRQAQIYSLGGIGPAAFARWPLLSRGDVLAAGDALLARTLPAAHGALVWNSTTGSTGQPVRVATSALGTLFQDALVLRSHFWYGLDFSQKFGSIRPGTYEPESADWGAVTRDTFGTGPSATFNLREDVDAQLDWLCRERPAYLLSRGHTLYEMLKASQARALRPAGLMALLSYADRPPEDLRDLARREWGVPVYDTYSAGECGVIALQCPAHDNMHVQSENLLVEILRDDGTPCSPGEVGRVVVTDLHNFAMPMIRYAIGDYAEAGHACPCGRGLPVIRRIAGRSSNRAITPDGRRFWPLISPYMWPKTPVTQRQLVQTTPAHIEVRYVAPRPLAIDEIILLRAELIVTFGHRITFEFIRVDAIERAAGAKFEEFISRVGAAS